MYTNIYSFEDGEIGKVEKEYFRMMEKLWSKVQEEMKLRNSVAFHLLFTA